MIKLFKYVLILFSFVFCEDKNSSVFVDGVAAVVGEHVILKSDVAQLVNIAAVQQRLNPAVDMKKLLFLQNEVLQSIVDQKILLEMAAVDSIEVDDKEIERALDQQIEMFVSQSGSEEQAEELLGRSERAQRKHQGRTATHKPTRATSRRTARAQRKHQGRTATHEPK